MKIYKTKTVVIPAGWRVLDSGTVILKYDRFWGKLCCQWISTLEYKKEDSNNVTYVGQKNNFIYIRRIHAKKT
jgi:hypothetical protein